MGTSWAVTLHWDFDDCLYLVPPLSLPQDIGICQYRCMPKSLVVLSPADTAACCAPVPQAALPSGQAGPVACCTPLSRVPLSPEQAVQVAPLLKALAQRVGPRMLSRTAPRPGGEACVCD